MHYYCHVRHKKKKKNFKDSQRFLNLSPNKSEYFVMNFYGDNCNTNSTKQKSVSPHKINNVCHKWKYVLKHFILKNHSLCTLNKKIQMLDVSGIVNGS